MEAAMEGENWELRCSWQVVRLQIGAILILIVILASEIMMMISMMMMIVVCQMVSDGSPCRSPSPPARIPFHPWAFDLIEIIPAQRHSNAFQRQHCVTIMIIPAIEKVILPFPVSYNYQKSSLIIVIKSDEHHLSLFMYLKCISLKAFSLEQLPHIIVWIFMKRRWWWWWWWWWWW